MPSSPIENRESRQYSIRLPWRVSDAVQDYASRHGMASNRAIIELLERGLHAESNTSCNTHSTTQDTTAQANPDLIARIEAVEARLNLANKPQQDMRRTARWDDTKHYLGPLCERGHNWQDTGQSRRSKRHDGCLECESQTARERRARAKAVAQA
jgi:hypothetical protein